MLIGIDHIVIAVRSVEDAAADLEGFLGLAFAGGGRHEAFGTYNRLAFLGETYLELIGVFDMSLVAANPGFAVGAAALRHLDHVGEGLVTYALASDAIDADVARLRAEGSPISLPVAGSRRRVDGELVRWWTAFPPSLGPDEPPFLIQHELAGAEWGDAARAERAAFRHPVGGAVHLVSLELPVGDPEAVAERYGRTLGIAFSEGWRVAIGDQAVVLSPRGTEPVVELAVDPGTPGLETVRHGVRWRRVATGADAGRRP
jgi:catechol 2,3-dioxygenase-like lactoylglutathione lyase family enzyme